MRRPARNEQATPSSHVAAFRPSPTARSPQLRHARALQYPSPSAASLGSSTRPLLLLVAFVVFLATCAVFLRGKPLLSHVGSAKTLYDVSSEFHRSDNNAMKASRRPCACVCGVAACAHAYRVILRMKTLMPTAPGSTREHVPTPRNASPRVEVDPADCIPGMPPPESRCGCWCAFFPSLPFLPSWTLTRF